MMNFVLKMMNFVVPSKEGLAAQDGNRAEGAALVLTGEGCVEVCDHKGAIAAYETALALDVNDAELTQSFLTGISDGKKELQLAVDTANSLFKQGKAAVAEQVID